MNKQQNSNYNNESITSLKGADRVRLRPGVIFGSDGLDGCAHAFFEILSNSIDEAREGYGKKIEIIRYKDQSIMVKDHGRGIPVDYNAKEEKTFDEILDFHVKFERIHPFQDGNGRVGRLIMFKECLKYNIVPFIIEDNLKMFYYRGLKEWNNEKGYLTDTCLTAQDKYKAYLDYFRIEY